MEASETLLEWKKRFNQTFYSKSEQKVSINLKCHADALSPHIYSGVSITEAASLNKTPRVSITSSAASTT